MTARLGCLLGQGSNLRPSSFGVRDAVGTIHSQRVGRAATGHINVIALRFTRIAVAHIYGKDAIRHLASHIAADDQILRAPTSQLVQGRPNACKRCHTDKSDQWAAPGG